MLIPIAAALVCLSACSAGILFFGHPAELYLHFPPQEIYIKHASFSGFVFSAYSIFISTALLFIIYLNRDLRVHLRSQPVSVFPRWGWLGVALMTFGWVAAWTRFDLFAPFQLHTFIPLWYGFIIFLNALLTKLTGRCPLFSADYLLLFPVSSLFWWFFELLNRAVQNWHYLNVESFSAPEYALFATLSFATVLPAVAVVFQILQALAADQAFSRKVACPRATAKGTGRLLVLTAVFGCFLLPELPNLLFPLLWVAPLMLLIGLQTLLGVAGPADRVAAGDWRGIVLWSLAALLCGVFWECWNYYSLAKWTYFVPYVEKFHIFEMPLLGYAGYLPFGVLCGAIIEQSSKRMVR